MWLFYQSEWFEIPFSTLGKISRKKIADSDFYRHFYFELFKKYKCYNSLPQNWQNEKIEIAKFILQKASFDRNLLSIGSGIGFVEHSICKLNQQVTVVGLEPSLLENPLFQSSQRFKVINGYFPQALNGSDIPNFGYSLAIEYGMTDYDFLNFSIEIKNSNLKRFLFLSASTVPDASFLTRATIWQLRSLKQWIHSYLKPVQRWGYVRSPSEHKAIFKKARLNILEEGFILGYWYCVIINQIENI